MEQERKETPDTEEMPPIEKSSQDKRLDLFLASFLMLFLELACIRWIPANIRLLSFFSNFVMLACFLGISTGFLLTRKKTKFILVTPCLLLLMTLIFTYTSLNIQFDPATFTQQIYYGAEIRAFHTAIPFPLVLTLAIALIGLTFIGTGQLVGQLFEGFPPLEAYLVNIGGSIAGTLLFALFSWCTQPPVSWFAVIFIVLLILIRREKPPAIASSLVVAGIMLFLLGRGTDGSIWSPYSKISFVKISDDHWGMVVNGISHQSARSRRELVKSGYEIPYLLKLSSSEPSLQEVLIIGSGLGNDVSQSLYCGAQHVDAVEIDPVIGGMGRLVHPEKPYLDPRVTLHIIDGRQFLNSTGKKYDMIIYAVVDSLSLFSSFSSVRLENYLFTEEAFREARTHLKPGGVMIVYNCFRRGWLARKTSETMERAFGNKTVVLSHPTHRTISDEEDISESPLVVLVNGNTELVTKNFEAAGNNTFWYWLKPYEKNLNLNGFKVSAPSPGDIADPVGLTTLEKGPSAASIKTPTDDWPFPYMRSPAIPSHYFTGILILLILSLLFIGGASGASVKVFSPHYFFLGAGFMLLETIGVIRFSQLFGSTWVNNVVVFMAIFLLILLANIYVLKKGKPGLTIPYICLVCAVLVNFVAGPSLFRESGAVIKYLLPPLILFLPILFAGVIFAGSFKEEPYPQQALASNILGAMAGGVLEYLSMGIGYSALLWVVMACYCLSWLFKKRAQPGNAGGEAR